MNGRRGEFRRLADTLINRPDEFLPWYNPKSIREYERVFDAEYQCDFHALYGEHNNKALLRLLSALIHSDEPEDIHCAITMLEAGLLLRPISTKRKKKLMYLLSTGYYRIGIYSKSSDLVNDCLEIAPQWWKAFALKLVIENRFKEEGVKDMLIAAAKTVGVAAGLPRYTTHILYPTRVIEAMKFKISVEDHFKKVVGAASFHHRIKVSLEKEMYRLAIQYVNMGKYSRSRLIIECCLEISPEWVPALTLKKSLDSKLTPRSPFIKELTKGDVFIIGFCFTFFYGWCVFSLSRKK